MTARAWNSEEGADVEPVRIMIVEDMPAALKDIKYMLNFEPGFEVVAVAVNEEEAVNKAERLRPHIILMDISKSANDGLAATRAISCRVPNSAVIMISKEIGQNYMRQAMTSGARDYIIKPVQCNELIVAIKRIYYDMEKKRQVQSQDSQPREGSVLTVFSTKGGVGKTTLAINLGACLAVECGFSVALLDLDLQFGDAAVMLNLMPRQTLSDLASEFSQLDGELLESYLVKHSSGLHLLAAPSRPEYAELVSAQLVEKTIKLLKERYDYVLIDTPGFFTDPTMVALDYAHQILLILTLELPTLKNIKLGLDVLDSLHHKDKIKAILNRATPELGICPADAEKSLGMPLTCQIASDGRSVVGAANSGNPFIIGSPQSRAAENLRQLAHLLTQHVNSDNSNKRKRGLLAGLFG